MKTGNFQEWQGLKQQLRDKLKTLRPAPIDLERPGLQAIRAALKYPEKGEEISQKWKSEGLDVT